ncbi:hypothetical protein EYC51_15960 [Alcaligenes faecalis]|nr:hypothetical protein EYC51_15960 [Alcaligenes faecalis]
MPPLNRSRKAAPKRCRSRATRLRSITSSTRTASQRSARRITPRPWPCWRASTRARWPRPA